MRTSIKSIVTAILSLALVLMLPCMDLNNITKEQKQSEASVINAGEIETDIGGSIADAEVVLDTDSFVYTGEEIKPQLTVKLGEEELNPDTDYNVEYLDNINVGTATIKVTGNGLYEGQASKHFSIEQKDLTDEDIIVDITNLKTFEFNGKDRTPIIMLKYNGKYLNPMADYNVEYKNNFYPGTASVVIQGVDNFKGEITNTFIIAKKLIGNVTIRTEFNSAKQLVIKVNNGSCAMTLNQDYSYTVYTDEIGNITITFRGLGKNYTGTYSRKIAAEDNPNRPLPPDVRKLKIKRVKNLKGRKAKVYWRRVEVVAGYQIRYCTNRKFKKAKTKTVNKNVGKYTINKLHKKTKYYIKIRAYKIFNGKNYYGEWSKIKTIKIKK